MRDELLTSREVSEFTNGILKEGTLRYWRHRGEGPKSFTLGKRKVVYKKSDVLEWLEANYAATAN